MMAIGVMFLALFQQAPRSDSALVQWVRQTAVPVVDSSFAFLPALTGNASVLALGEPVHGGHEPLEYRNRLIRYAVTDLGFSAVALESGFTQGNLVDAFIQGGPGNIDEVVRTGLTWSFQNLPENRELILWLREYNAHATRKVHFYGIDLTGGEDEGLWPDAHEAPLAALRYLATVAPTPAKTLSAQIVPLMDRFIPARYAEYSAAERTRLGSALDALYRALVTDSSRFITAGTRRGYATGVREAWMARYLNHVIAVSGAEGSPEGALLRDSAMAENVMWALRQEGSTGRIVLFAHDAHVMNAPFTYNQPPYSGSWKMQGVYLRSWLGPKLVVLGSAVGMMAGKVNGNTGWLEPPGETRADSTTFTAVLAKVGLPMFVLDLRKGDAIPAVRSALQQPWPFQLLVSAQSMSPRQTFDAMVFFGTVHPALGGGKSQ